MKILIIILVIVLILVLAYLFPKGVKILGIPTEILFSKHKSEDEDSNH